MVLNMLTTIAMIRVGKTYGNLMVDVQTGSEKLQGPRAAHRRDRDRRRRPKKPASCCTRAKWNVKAAIVMKKAGVTLRAGAAACCKRADDSIREALGEDLEPTLRKLLDVPSKSRSRRPSDDASPLRAPRRSSDDDDTFGCSCSSEAGTRVVIGPVERAPHDRRLGAARREQHDRARAQDRADAHRQRATRHASRVAVEQLRVARGASLDVSVDAVRARHERGRRLVEAEVAVAADPEEHEVEAAGRGDRGARSARASRRQSRAAPFRNVDPRRARG